MAKKLGEILIEMGIINKQQLETTLTYQQNQGISIRQPIGQILIIKGLCTPDQLVQALELQKASEEE